jgi:hypothetical protein
VERNAKRAALVKRAEDWLWSSQEKVPDTFFYLTRDGM